MSQRSQASWNTIWRHFNCLYLRLFLVRTYTIITLLKTSNVSKIASILDRSLKVFLKCVCPNHCLFLCQWISTTQVIHHIRHPLHQTSECRAGPPSLAQSIEQSRLVIDLSTSSLVLQIAKSTTLVSVVYNGITFCQDSGYQSRIRIDLLVQRRLLWGHEDFHSILSRQPSGHLLESSFHCSFGQVVHLLLTGDC